MPYFWPAPDPRPYFCHNCGVWYVEREDMRNVSCAVQHGPGACCHYTEKRVDPPPPHQPPVEEWRS